MADDEILSGFVIDNGASWTRGGFSGDPSPRAVFPTLVGRLRPNADLFAEELGLNDICVGDEALSKRGQYDLGSPISRGLVTNFDDMERIWHHVFYEQLKLCVYDCSTIMTESVLNSTKNRETTTQIMFETFDSPAFFMHNSATFAFLSSGKSSGILVESGHDTTTVSPFIKGKLIKHAVQSMDIGGEELTEYFSKMLGTRSQVDFATAYGRTLASYIKEYACHVALDPERPGKENYTYEVDGSETRIQIMAEERYRCPEVLFQPPLLGLECDGIHQMIFNAINKTDPAMHKQLWKGIVLAGGNTMFPGLQARLQKELTALAPKDCEVGIIAPPDRKYSAFGGASLMASHASFQKYWITKELYDDYGPSICEMKQKEIDMGPV